MKDYGTFWQATQTDWDYGGQVAGPAVAGETRRPVPENRALINRSSRAEQITPSRTFTSQFEGVTLLCDRCSLGTRRWGFGPLSKEQNGKGQRRDQTDAEPERNAVLKARPPTYAAWGFRRRQGRWHKW